MKLFILTAMFLAFVTPVNSIDLGGVLKDQAMDSVKDQAMDSVKDQAMDSVKDQAMDSVKDQAMGSMKEQAVDKGVDMGAEYAKGSLKSVATPSSGSSASGSLTDMALKAAAKSGMADSAVDTGADYSKTTIKGLIK